jgi:small nuclear ribonucleoprotein (snRNP)-like protein
MAETPKFSYKRVFKNVTIRTTDGSTLSGKVNIGIKDRLSDLFTKGESPFVVLFDAGYKDSHGKVFIVNKNNIVWVEPEE